jgi:hypothetical protein
LFLTPTLVYNVSFLLSFGAAFGLAAFTPLWAAAGYGAKGNTLPQKAIAFFRNNCREFFSMFYGAQIFTLPLIYYFFARVSNIAVVSNFFVLPVVGVILSTAIIFTVFAPLGYWIGDLLSFPLNLLLGYFIGVINFTAKYNGENLVNTLFSSLTLLCVTAMITAVFYAFSFRRGLFRAMAAGVAAIFAVLSAATILFPYDAGKIHVTFTGCKDTSSAVITTGTGENIYVGSLKELEYWIADTPIKLNTSNPLIILTDADDPAVLKALAETYRIKNIVVPASYKYTLTFMPNVTFIEGNTNAVYKDLEISVVSDGALFYETVFGYKGTKLSFSCNGQYVLDSVMTGDGAKYAVINCDDYRWNSGEKDPDFTENSEKIKNSENFNKSLVLFSKKYYNDYIKRYDNFSIVEFDENGVRSINNGY